MKQRWIQGIGLVGRRAGFVSGWLFSGAFLGLLIGLFEAWLLWTRPRVIPLLVPDVGYVVWFLAPLIDMAFFALVGLSMGWLASRVHGKEVFAALEAAITITFVILMLAWFHVEIGLHPFNFNVEVVIPLAVFTVAFVLALVIFAATWSRLEGYWLHRFAPLIRPLAWGLAAASVIAIAGICAFALWPPISGPAAPPTVAPRPGAPNIVFITLDTVRADHLSSYGYSRPTTPNLDRFARTGVLFENAIAPSSWTLASHASMFTGLLPQQHGADWATPLAQGPWTLAEALRSEGYQTAGFAANYDYMQRGWGIAQGFETYDDNSDWLQWNLAQTFLGNATIQPLYQGLFCYRPFARRSAQQINTRVFHWYAHSSRRPFFLFINYMDAHEPYVTSAPYEGRFGEAPMWLIRKLHFVSENVLPASAISREEGTLLKKSYDDCLAYLDSQVGNLLRFLRKSPKWQSTIVIITSDHGEEFGGHGSFDHGLNLYRDVLHVPLIIAGPGVPKDMRISHVVATRQLFSTILDLAGGGHTRFSRISLARFWNPAYKPTFADNAVVSELIPLFGLGVRSSMMSLTTPRWEYVVHHDGRQELYNWTTDQEEKDNLASSPLDQSTLKNLRSRLLGLVSNATGPWRGMGYLQALDSVTGSRLSLLFPKPVQPRRPGNKFRIGVAQAHFDSQKSLSVHPAGAGQNSMRSLPYH